MWYLTSENDDRLLYILPTTNVIIGRSPDAVLTTFVITDDPSISRKHANITVSDSSPTIEDLGSRYGTFCNDVRLEVNVKVQLNENDIIRFGKINSVWKVHAISFITCTSTLKGENLQIVKSILTKLGGQLNTEWDDSCAYLTMPAITLTIKVVLALVQGSNIVTPLFWSKCIEAINTNAPLPDPKDFIPQVIESTLNKEKVSFLHDVRRGKIFQGKKFIFFSKKQLEMYRQVLTKSSAVPLLLSESKMTKSMLCEKDIIVIQYTLSGNQDTQMQIKNQISDIVEYLKTKGRRVIADAEIGLAVLYCSTEKYCNPEFNFSSEVIKQSALSNTGRVLAVESQDSNTNQVQRENVVIDQSLHSLDDENNSSKRKLSNDSDYPTSANKKIAVNPKYVEREFGKRKFDDSESESNVSKKMAIDDADEEDLFNFNKPSSDNRGKVTENKLNLIKPIKRKGDSPEADEEDLFNFIPNAKTAKVGSNSMFEAKNDSKSEAHTIPAAVAKEEVDISAMRGAKLNELSNKLNSHQVIKKEPSDDLEGKMNKLDLGTTIVKIRADLIIKKEPIEIKDDYPQVKNFKKFKKVWPVKMQVTFTSAPSDSTIATNGSQVF